MSPISCSRCGLEGFQPVLNGLCWAHSAGKGRVHSSIYRAHVRRRPGRRNPIDCGGPAAERSRVGRIRESGHRESGGGEKRRIRKPARFCQEQTDNFLNTRDILRASAKLWLLRDWLRIPAHPVILIFGLFTLAERLRTQHPSRFPDSFRVVAPDAQRRRRSLSFTESLEPPSGPRTTPGARRPAP